ncbi:MAG: SDR family oxidoreductase [Herpetosiphonaceae bacterium]|nr:SDR family oxidoreductase [Herpetosiphonaceae bacterium]
MSDYLDGSEIAIIGMVGRFPGAPNLDVFWNNVRDGVESISFLSDEELLARGVKQELLADPHYVKAVSMPTDIEYFDAEFFGINHREAELTDPQQRLFLECAWEALEHAGYNPETYRGPIGVFGGATLNTYLLFNLLANPSVAASVDPVQIDIGNAGDYLTTRVSYKLNLKGPSHLIQSACSTSLVAVHVACQSLLNEECDMALAGGVAINVQQMGGYQYLQGGINSPDGHCRAFDAKAQGTIFGSGVGIVVLKRLEDALADGDCIHAVLRGSAINNDGSLKVGYTAPSVDGQAQVISEALGNAGIGADTLSYVEAHGTGTPLGDPIEVQALTKAFRGDTDKQGFCALGSVKTNVGHLGIAAGITSLLKTVLALKHRQLPPSLHFEQPNPEINFAHSPFFVNTQLTPWQRGDHARRAGVSSFGMGGTNVHVIVEEAPVSTSSPTAQPWQLLLLSTKSATALDVATANLAEWLRRQPELNLADVAYTLQVGRQAFSHRRIIVCRDTADALELLQQPDGERMISANVQINERPTVWLFPGQGVQYVNMGRELYVNEPVFREHIDRCAELLKPHLLLDLREVLYPAADRAEMAAQQLEQTALTQPALFVVEYALAQLWQAWGIAPQAMIGHSIGEYVAACVAGVFTLEDALELVAVRGRLMQSCPPGGMLAVPLAEPALQPWLQAPLSLAAINGPAQCVVAGPEAPIRELAERLAAAGITTQRLHTSHAFHSAMLDPIIAPFTAHLDRIKLQAPRLPFISNISGSWITAAEATDPAYWARHLRQTVRFADGVHELLRMAGSVFLEVGPGRSLSSLVRQQCNDDPARIVIGSLRHPQQLIDDRACLRLAMGKLWLAGVTLTWPSAAPAERRRVPLPTYPFERQRYWIEPQVLPIHNDGRETTASQKVDLSDWFYLPSWKRTSLASTSQLTSTSPQLKWLVWLDGCGVGAALVQQLQAAQQQVIQVQAGAQFQRIAPNLYSLDPRQAADYHALVGDLVAHEQVPQHIVHVWNVTAAAQPMDDQAAFEHVQLLNFYSLLYLTQALGQQPATPVRLSVVSNNLQEVADHDLLAAEKATLVGLCKVIPQEYPHISCASIDIVLPNGTLQPLVNQLISEIMSNSTERVVAYRGKFRWVQSFEAIHLPAEASPPARLKTGGTYLITGGLGGVGLTIAEHLARTVQAKLVLVGRTRLPEQADWPTWLLTRPGDDLLAVKLRKVQALEALGAEVLVLSADVGDAEQMAAVFANAHARFGTLDGVVHAASVVNQTTFTTIQELSPGNCEAQFRPKVHGLYVLAELCATYQPAFCLLVSSLATVLGGLGAAAFAAANAFMDVFAQQQNRNGTTTWISVNWDTWKLGKDAAEDALLASIASLAMTPEEGVDAFDRLLALETTSQVVVSTSSLEQRLVQWIKRTPSMPAAAAEATIGTLHARPELQTAYVAPHNEYERNLAEIWQQVLGVERVGVHDDFFELGGHSLLITQLLNKLQQAYPVTISMRSLFEHPTLGGMAQLVEMAVSQVDQVIVRPIREQLHSAAPAERQSLLQTYLHTRVAQALNRPPEQLLLDTQLTAAELRTMTPDLIWNLQQDLRLQLYQHEIPQLHSIRAMGQFIAPELDRLAALKQVTYTAPAALYDRYEAYSTEERWSTRHFRTPASKNNSMVFLHSSPRSGSTLLRVMLAGHPDLFSPPELDILWYAGMREWQRGVTDPTYGHGFAWASEGLQWTFMQLLGRDTAATKTFLDELVAQDTSIQAVYAQLQELVKPQLLIDKSPSYSLSLSTLRHAEDLFDGPKYIHLVRHPYAMIESFLRIRLDKLFGPSLYNERTVDPYVIAEKVWYSCNQNIRTFLQQVDPARQLVVYYEELVKDPARSMSEICSFLGISFDPAVLQPYDDKHERMITGIGDPNILQHNKVDPELGEAWKQIRLPHALGEQTQRLAAEFGYTLPGNMLDVPATDPLHSFADAVPEQLAQLLQQVEQLSAEEVQKLLAQMQ